MQPKGLDRKRVRKGDLTVRLLVASTSSRSSELLGFASAWVGHQQGLVIGSELFLQLLLALLVHVLVVECNLQIYSLPLLMSATSLLCVISLSAILKFSDTKQL